MLNKIALGIVCVLFMACTAKKTSENTLGPSFEAVPKSSNMVATGTVSVLKSASLTLSVPSSLKGKNTKTAYILVRQGEKEAQELQKALEDALRQKGYVIEDNPSRAHYVLHANVAYAGSMPTHRIKALVDAGYAAPIAKNLGGATGHVDAAKMDAKNSLPSALVLDVLLAVRTLPEDVRSRPHVVITSAKNTKVAENSGRMAVVNVQDDDDEEHAFLAMQLAKSAAKEIAKALP